MTEPRSEATRQAAWVQYWAQQGMAPPLNITAWPAPVYQQPVPVVVRPAQKFPHGIHVVLTLLSCGLWLPVYALHYLLHVMHPASKAKVEYH